MDGIFKPHNDWDPVDVLAAINDALLTGVCITDRTGHFVSVSRGWCAIYGLQEEDALGRHFTMVVPPEQREEATRLHDAFIQGAEEIPGEWEVLRPDGRRIWIRVGAARFFDAHGEPFKVTTVEDITARKQAERALAESHARLERINRDKDRLFSIIGHDLKGPFTPILGYSEVMASLGQSLTVPQALDYAGHIQEAATHALGLLETLLDWARLQGETGTPDPVQQPLGPIVDEAVKALAAVAQRKGITVSVSASPVKGCVDRYMLTTAIRNLVSNALKFTHEGGRVSVAVETDQGGDVLVRVADTGIGMTPEVLAKVLGAGEAPSTAGTANEMGTGLGLRVSRELVERHNGRLSAESVPGQGSTFTITLPAAC
ncbi:PAS domain-containing sensor histidine kinase [uncultured Rhodospira sp.]|uniref:PAS domain-containing sensor histidine kinase n=1 Tax=uncultured Rhodospira sp. TaxID=1936189 RepID=UPI002604D936|nr:PAS domain-containing sensor histidine kinase [uncultured Rhodospira sp.]